MSKQDEKDRYSPSPIRAAYRAWRLADQLDRTRLRFWRDLYVQRHPDAVSPNKEQRMEEAR